MKQVTAFLTGLALITAGMFLMVAMCRPAREIPPIPRSHFSSIQGESGPWNQEDIATLNGILQKSPLGELGKIPPPEMVLWARSETDGTKETLSIYLNQRAVYFGDWLDARTVVLMDKPVPVLRLTHSDIAFLKRLAGDR